jgi:ABC-2 type transport system ATP-binding protein
MADDAVVAQDLRVSFGSTQALDGVSFAVPRGTVLGLLGPNGAGKTTAVRVLTTLLRPDSGRAEVAGVDVLADPARVRRRIGLAGQYAAVDENLTGRENLRLFGTLYRLEDRAAARADELLERFDLVEAADRVAKTYSGGMRRRLDLAASLVNRPQVLFLDEPTTGLDPRSRLALWDVIEDLVDGGTTLLLTTQYLEEADRLADRIAVIDNGRVIAEGTADELKTRTGGQLLVLRVGRADVAAARAALAPLDEVGRTRTARSPSRRPTAGRSSCGWAQVLGEAASPSTRWLRRPRSTTSILNLTGRAARPTRRRGGRIGRLRGPDPVPG